MKLFLSNGRDELVPEVRALKQAMQARGHEIWFDRVVLTMTPHSVRRPDGYCLNENCPRRWSARSRSSLCC
jgi:hypothetical protein